MKESIEYQWGFHISLDAAKQCLGQWAEWASKKDLLTTPIADRTDSPDIKALSQSRASELLFPILTQKLDSCSKAMVILRRMTDNGGAKMVWKHGARLH